MNIEQFKEKIKKEIAWINTQIINESNEGRMQALEWVLDQFEEEHELLRNS